jgi:Protein of unknown function (DUF4238)
MWREFVKSQGNSIDLTFQEAVNALRESEVTVNEKYALMNTIQAAEKIGSMFVDMDWCLCVVPDETFLLTSDAPVTLFRPHGLSTIEGAEVTFPLSPSVYIFLNHRRAKGRRRVNDQSVKDVNRRTVYTAERFVISSINTKYARDLVAKFSSTRKTRKINREQLMWMHHLRRSS